MTYKYQKKLLFPLLALVVILLILADNNTAFPNKKESKYIYASPEEVTRHFSLITDNPEFNSTWAITIPEILSRQLENGEFIESSQESGMYPHCFPRNVFPDVLLRCGYTEEVRKYLDFMWKNQKKDGSFWNYFDKRGKGAGIVEEDGGAYIIWQTYLYYLHTKDPGYLWKHWDGVKRAIEFFKNLRDEELGLFYSTAGYSEGNIKGGFNVYHQSISVLAFRSATRIAQVLGKTMEAQEYNEIARELPGLIKRHLYDEEKGRFVFQLRKDGTINDKPYPAFLVLGYYDVFDPVDEALQRTIQYVREGPLYGKYSEELFGFEGIDVERITGSGFWIGQAGHGWMTPYLLKKGDLREAAIWFEGLVATRDKKTNLIPEHINWAGFDEDGGSWQGETLGVIPSPSAWVDPGNLYSMGTAIRVVFFMIDSRMDGPTPMITLRIPEGISTISASNIRTPSGYVDIIFERDEGSTSISVNGEGEGSIKILLEGQGKPSISRNGERYDHFSFSDSPPAIEITTDFTHHTFQLLWE
jgi:hypothetical protein